MMWKKRSVSVGTIVVLLISFGILILIATKEELPEHIYTEAKVVSYTDSDALINEADVIAVCEKISEDDSTVERTEQGDLLSVYTLSTLEIKHIEKGNLLKDDKLVVMENEGYVEEENAIYHIEGYERMKVGKQYLLLLRKSETDPWYITLGVNYGKIPLDKNEKVLMEDADADQIREVETYHASIREELYNE